MNKELERDLQKCLSIINPDWSMQNDGNDKETYFIYQAETLDECLKMIEAKGVDKDYALHRWYNYQTSVYCEYLFCDYGAVHDENIFSHDVDIYINGIPYDVKLTVYPNALRDNRRDYNLRSSRGKNKMIKWLYANQSQQGRKQLINRIYVMCDAETPYDRMRLKSNFTMLRRQIAAYMNYIKTHEPNETEIVDGKRTYKVMSELIYVSFD